MKGLMNARIEITNELSLHAIRQNYVLKTQPNLTEPMSYL